MYEDSLKFDFNFSDDDLAADGLVRKCDFEKARVLLGAITKILGFTKNDKLSLTSNFFEIGGDSLNMVQVIGICAEVGCEIGMTEFALCSNLADLIRTLRSPSDDLNSDLSTASVLKLDELKAASKGNIVLVAFKIRLEFCN